MEGGKLREKEVKRDRQRKYLLAPNTVKLNKIQEQNSFRHSWVQGPIRCLIFVSLQQVLFLW